MTLKIIQTKFHFFRFYFYYYYTQLVYAIYYYLLTVNLLSAQSKESHFIIIVIIFFSLLLKRSCDMICNFSTYDKSGYKENLYWCWNWYFFFFYHINQTIMYSLGIFFQIRYFQYVWKWLLLLSMWLQFFFAFVLFCK